MRNSGMQQCLCEGIHALGGRIYALCAEQESRNTPKVIVLPGGRILFALIGRRKDARQSDILESLRGFGTEAYALHTPNDVSILLRLCREYIEGEAREEV